MHLAEVHRELVEQDERRLAAEQLAQRVGSRRDAAGVAVPHPVVARLAGERVGELAPRRVRPDALPHRPPVGGIGVLAVERGKAHRTTRQERRIDELVHAGHPRHASGRMRQCDQGMRLAAAVRRIEAEDGGRFAPRAAQAPADVGQQVLQAAGRIAVGEEPDRIDVLGASDARDHLCEVGGEVRFRHRPAKHVRTGATGLEDRLGGHGLSRPRFRGASPATRTARASVRSPPGIPAVWATRDPRRPRMGSAAANRTMIAG